MTTIAVYNIKGGVGKTATAVNLSYLASREGARTLLVDLDPQGSASFYFRVRPKKKFSNRLFIEDSKKNTKHIRGTDYENLDSLPSCLSFRKMDIVLDGQSRSKTRLKAILKPFQKDYDYLFLDCPPNITLVSDNIFRASDMLLVPIIPTTLSMLTYNKLIGFFNKRSLDDKKIVAFFSMMEKRKRIHQDIIQSIGKKDRHFLKTSIPYASDVEKMGIYREPIFCYRPRSTAALAYRALWKEVKKRVKQ